jgi:hypothetical protein
MSARVMAFVVLVVGVGAGCGDDAQKPDAAVAGAGAPAVAGGVGGGGSGASAGHAGSSAGVSGTVAGIAGGSGGGALGTDICARAPVDSCDLVSTCESVKAQRDCAGAIKFVACAPKVRSCAPSPSYCAKDANGVEWYFPTSCGKEQIQRGAWTVEPACGCSVADAGVDDAGL